MLTPACWIKQQQQQQQQQQKDHYIHVGFLFENEMVFIFNKLKSALSKDVLCQVCFQYWQSAFGKDFWKSSSFHCLAFISLWTKVILYFPLLSMVAYFCHHLSDNYVDLSDRDVDLSVIYVDLSDHCRLVRKISSQLVAKYLIFISC